MLRGLFAKPARHRGRARRRGDGRRLWARLLRRCRDCFADRRFQAAGDVVGLIPAQIAPFLVERLGYSEAKRIAVTGARFGADEAYRIGLVHRVCANEAEVEEAVAATLRQILVCAPGAVAETKKSLRRARSEYPAEPRGARRLRVRQGRARRGRRRGPARLRRSASRPGPIEAIPQPVAAASR